MTSYIAVVAGPSSHATRRRETLEAIHSLLAYGAAAATAAGIGWSLVLVARGRAGASSFERFQAAVVALFLVGAASGGLLAVAGARPADGLHVLYAVVALAVIPLARSFLGRPSPRATAILFLAAFVVLGTVTFRLFTTG